MALQTQVDQSKVAQLSKQFQEPEWLLKFRQKALEKVNDLPLPVLQKTSIDHWNFSDFTLPVTEEVGELPSYVREMLFEEKKGNRLVQKNATVVTNESVEENGVIFCDIATAAREHEELFKKYFMTEAMKVDESRLSALHAALFTGGVFIYVPRNVDVSAPMQALFLLDGKGLASMPHVLLVAEENSRVDLVVNFAANHQNTGALQNAVVEVIVGNNAQVRVATVNDQGSGTVDAVFRRSEIKRDGRLEWIVADLSEGHTISHTKTNLVEPGGEVQVSSIALGTKELRANYTSEISHFGKGTSSNINARTVMKDKANSVLNSITKIERGASKADGQQSGKVLMLNREARGDANPILLIDENDVTAGHAASAGRIDPIQLYYLMSRGLPKEEAEKLVILGFLDAVIANIPSDSLRKSIYRLMERKLTS